MTSTILYQVDGLPTLQNRVYATREQALNCATGDLRLVQDQRSSLVFNELFDDSLVTYDARYQNEQAHSAAFREHLEQMSQLVIEGIGRSNLVEIGCGKGSFLELLQSKSCEVTGYDSAYEGTNRSIVAEPFASHDLSTAKGIVLRHVLEHVRDPSAFLDEIKSSTSPGTLIYIEVPCLEWILEQRAVFDLFYEHVNYFRLSDFDRFFGSVRFASHAFGGQYLSVIADLHSLRSPAELPFDPVDFPEDFSLALHDAIATESANVIWGGSSKGVIYALLRERAGNPVQRVIDINPSKQGRYLPVTGLLVESPTDVLKGLAEDDPILVMNPNYLTEVRSMTGPRRPLKVLSE